ncbi:MAG: response regulator, partial [Acidobacteriota bacterium]
ELLLTQMSQDDPRRSSVLEMQKAIDQGAKLTNQLLAFSRKQIISPKILDLNQTISEIEKILHRLVGENVDLSIIFSEGLGHIKADPGQIEQLMINLVVNARDAMPEGGKLTVEITNVELDENYAFNHAVVKPGRYVMLAITDTGCGIDEATLTRIFEPFFTTKEEGKGTGLGLSTVYGIVKQSGAHIWVYSQLAIGTTFKIYFPRVDEELEKVIAPATAADLTGRGEVILLVDDNQSVRTAVGTYLEMKGYQVFSAGSGKEALEISRKEKGPIHLIVTDMVMPEMTGPQLVSQIISERPQLKVLFMSGYTDESIKRSGMLQAGAAFLQKPASMESLLRKIRELFG